MKSLLTALPLIAPLLLVAVACAGLATSNVQVITEPAATTGAPQPTEAPTPRPTVKPAPTPTPTATVTPVPAPMTDADIIATIVATGEPRILSYPSPDDWWRGDVIIYDCPFQGAEEYAYEQLNLVRVSDGSEEIVDSQFIYCGGLGAFGLDGLFWSSNSRYFYYTNAREGVPDGCGNYWQRPLIRLDTSDQTVEYLGGGPHSPDGTKVATWQGQELVVWGIEEGETGRVAAAVPEATTGVIAWAPDGQALVYLQGTDWCYLTGTSYVVLLDLAEFEQSLLLESEGPVFGNVAWDAPDQIRLFAETVDGEEWVYDLVAQDLSPVP